MNAQDLVKVIHRAREFEWKTLDLSGENIEYLPDEIGQLTTLTQLFLDRNLLRRLPESIGNLVNLNQVNLNENHLDSFPDSIGNLIYLNQLSANSNFITELPESIGNLTSLTRLCLNSNRITALPDSIARLASLTRFELNDNLLSRLPETLGNLSGLAYLSLDNNRLISLPDGIAEITSLTTLSASGNKLSFLPDSLEKRIGLKWLNMSRNRIKTLPAQIGKLLNLISLDLSENRLTRLPDSIGRLRKIKHFYLHHNPLSHISPDIVAEGGEAVLDYYREFKLARGNRYEGRLLLVGDSGVGKTCLAKALCGQYFQNQQPTPGFQIMNRVEPNPEDSSQALTLNIWDFGGEEATIPLAYRFFIRRGLYLLVVDATQAIDHSRICFWLDLIKACATQARVLIVATKVTKDIPRMDFDRLKKEYGDIIYGKDFYQVNSASKDGIDALSGDINRHAWSLELMGHKWPHSFSGVVTELERRIAAGEVIIEKNKLKQIISNASREVSQNFERLTRILEDMGRLVHFPGSHAIGNLIVIDTQWLANAIALVFKSEEVKKEDGLLRHKLLLDLWTGDLSDYREELLHVLENMEFCVPSQQDNRYSIIPTHLPGEPPGNIPWTASPGIQQRRISYRLNFAPPGIIGRFMAKTQRMMTQTYWKNGVFLCKGQAEALCEYIPSKNEITIEVRSVYPLNLLERLTGKMEMILDRFEGLKYKKILGVVGNQPIVAVGSEIDLTPQKIQARSGKAATEAAPNTRTQVNDLDLVCGLKVFTTHQDVLKSIENKVVQARKEMHPVRNSVITTGKKLIEMFEHQQRIFIDWLWHQDKEVFSQFPALLVISPSSTKRSKATHWADRTYQLGFYCQAEEGIHPVGKSYEFKRPIDWWQRMHPYFVRMMSMLEVTGSLAGPILPSYLPRQVWRRVRTEFEMMKEILDEIGLHSIDPQRLGEWRQERIFSPDETVLTAIASIIQEIDKRENWRDYLTNTPTPDGKSLWLCNEHLYKYFPRKPEFEIGDINEPDE